MAELGTQEELMALVQDAEERTGQGPSQELRSMRVTRGRMGLSRPNTWRAERSSTCTSEQRRPR